MPPRRWDESCKTRDEGERRKVDAGSAIRPGLLKVDPDGFVVEDLEAVVGERRAQNVFAQGEPALFVVGSDPGCSMQVEPVLLCAQLALCDRLVVGVKHDADGDGRGEAAWGRGRAGRP